MVASSPIAAEWPSELQRIDHTFPLPIVAPNVANVRKDDDVYGASSRASAFPFSLRKQLQPKEPPPQQQPLSSPARRTKPFSSSEIGSLAAAPPRSSPTSTDAAVPVSRRRRRRRISEPPPTEPSASLSSAATIPAASSSARLAAAAVAVALPSPPPMASSGAVAAAGTSGSNTAAAVPITSIATTIAAAATTTTIPTTTPTLTTTTDVLASFAGLPHVDFYRAPTILSRLILNQKYDAAMGRLKRHPNEARIWVCAKRRTNPSTYAVRQLPVHVACWNLGRTIDRSWRESLNQLITHLVVTFPDACACEDHTHTLPIQYAVRYAAHASTVSMLLMAHPESLHCTTPENEGRHTLSDLNQASSSPYMKQTQQVLGLDVAFWQQSRQEANFRLQQQQQQQQQEQQEREQQSEPAPEPTGATVAAEPPTTRAPPDAVASSDSLPFGASALQPKSPPRRSTLVAPPASPASSDDTPRNDSAADDENLEPAGWEQLEERAVAMEQILTEMNEKNFILHRRIERLAQSKIGLLDQVDRLKKSHLVQETHELQQQNQRLHREVLNMERRLREAWASSAPTAPRTAAAASPGESSTLVGHSPSPPTSGSSDSKRALQADNLQLLHDNHALRLKYDDLNRSYRQQQHQLHKLVQVVRQMQRDAASIVGATADENNDPSHVSTLSASLLTSEDEASSISDSGGLRQSRHDPAYPRRQRTIEIEWHTPPSGGGGRRGGAHGSRGRVQGTAGAGEVPGAAPLQDLSDNLSAVFRHAQELMPSPLTPTASASNVASPSDPPHSGQKKKPGPSSPLSAMVSPLQRYTASQSVPAAAPATQQPPAGVGEGSFSSLDDDDDASHDLVLPALLEVVPGTFQPVSRVGVSRSGLTANQQGRGGGVSGSTTLAAPATTTSAMAAGSVGSI